MRFQPLPQWGSGGGVAKSAISIPPMTASHRPSDHAAAALATSAASSSPSSSPSPSPPQAGRPEGVRSKLARRDARGGFGERRRRRGRPPAGMPIARAMPQMPQGIYARARPLMFAASLLILLAQLYLSRSLHSAFRAMPPAQHVQSITRHVQSAMPRVTLEDGSLCHAAPWSLAHLRAQCRAGPLRYYYAYAALHSSWNAFQHIRRHAPSRQ